MVTQEMAEEANRSIVKSIDTARIVVEHAYDEIDDEWYRSYIMDLGGVLYHLGQLVERLNDLYYPISPGKYAPLLMDVKKMMGERSMTEEDLRNFLHGRGLEHKDAERIIEYIATDPDISEGENGLGASNIKRTVYLDDRGMYNEDSVRRYCEKQAELLGIKIRFVLCNNPFGDKIEVQIKDDGNTFVHDVKELAMRLRKEFGTYVNVNLEYGIDEVLELS